MQMNKKSYLIPEQAMFGTLWWLMICVHLCCMASVVSWIPVGNICSAVLKFRSVYEILKHSIYYILFPFTITCLSLSPGLFQPNREPERQGDRVNAFVTLGCHPEFYFSPLLSYCLHHWCSVPLMIWVTMISSTPAVFSCMTSILYYYITQSILFHNLLF